MKKNLPALALVAAALFASSHSQAQMIVLNPGFEITDAGFPGGAQNWYGYTNNGASGTLAQVTQTPNAVFAGTNGFLLNPVSTGPLAQASLGSDLWAAAAGSTNQLSFQLKFIGATAPNVWGEYGVSFHDSSFIQIAFTNQAMPYSWGAWSNVTFGDLVAPAGTAYIGVNFYANALNTGYLEIAVDDVNLTSVPEPSTYALLALSSAALAGYRLRRRTR